METQIKGYHQQLHFKCNDLELFYNLPIVANSNSGFDKCPHIDELMCSHAKILAPDRCISDRKCELYELKKDLFFELGILGSELTKLDEYLRKK